MQHKPTLIQGKRYRILTAVNEKYALDISTSKKHLNKLIVQEKNKEQTNQKYYFKETAPDKYHIISAKDGQVLEVPNQENGARVGMAPKKNEMTQIWKLKRVQNPEFSGKLAFYIESFIERYLDLSEEKAKNDNPVIQWNFHGYKNQTWILEQA